MSLISCVVLTRPVGGGASSYDRSLLRFEIIAVNRVDFLPPAPVGRFARRRARPFTRGPIVNGKQEVSETLWQCVNCNRVRPAGELDDHEVEVPQADL